MYNSLKYVSLKKKPETPRELNFATSKDVAFFVQDYISGDRNLQLINLDSKGCVINTIEGDLSYFMDNKSEIFAKAFLSNTSHWIFAKNCIDETTPALIDTGEIINSYGSLAKGFGISLLDYVEVFGDDKQILSYLEEPQFNKLRIMANDELDIIADHTYYKSGVEEKFKNYGKYNQLQISEDKLIMDINDKKEAIEYLIEDIASFDREAFYVLSLDENNKPINVNIASLGNLNQTICTAREVYKVPILSGASSVVFLHNHPSGKTEPSKDDLETTKILIRCGNILGICVNDHIVVGDKENYISLKEFSKSNPLLEKTMRFREFHFKKEVENLRKRTVKRELEDDFEL